MDKVKLIHPDLDVVITVPEGSVPSLLRKGWQESREGHVADTTPFAWSATDLGPTSFSTSDSTIAPATPGDASEGTPSLTSQEG